MEPTKQNTVDQFFNDLPNEDKTPVDIFEKEPAAAPEKAGADAAGTGEDPNGQEPRKNRRHRRLEAQLQSEREANIALNERVKVLSESEKFAKESAGEVDPRIARMFNPDDPIGKQNAIALTQVIREMSETAREDAIKEFETRQESAQREQREYETFIDNEFEYLEEEYGVDLTSDAPAARKARREFIDLVQDISPKDENGELSGFADFDKAFQLYQKTKTESRVNPSTDRRKEIASTSMQKSGQGAGVNSPKPRTPGFRGWMKDYNM